MAQLYKLLSQTAVITLTLSISELACYVKQTCIYMWRVPLSKLLIMRISISNTCRFKSPGISTSLCKLLDITIYTCIIYQKYSIPILTS